MPLQLLQGTSLFTIDCCSAWPNNSAVLLKGQRSQGAHLTWNTENLNYSNKNEFSFGNIKPGLS